MEETKEIQEFKEIYKKSIIKKLRQKELSKRDYIKKNHGLDEDDEEIEIFTDLNFIKKIDNIDVYVRIYVSSDSINLKIFRNNFRFKIFERNLLYFNTYDEYECGYIKNIIKLSLMDWDKCIYDILELKYNKTTDSLNDFEITDKILKQLGHDVNDCCVCYDNTIKKTKCGHHLCYDCFYKLKNKNCPMCREKILNEDLFANKVF